MRYFFIVVLAIIFDRSAAQNTSLTNPAKTSPLSVYSNEWNKPVYSGCNTAENDTNMNDKEKEVIYILNLARAYPKLFANTVLAKYPSLPGNERLINNIYYYQSLVKTMLAMDQMPLLYADEKCFMSAECHAIASGEAGYTGHERKSALCKAKQHFFGECCDYGNAAPADIILTLLIDENVPSLGHRKILLGNYSMVGVSTQPHKTYRQNTVLDFYN